MEGSNYVNECSQLDLEDLLARFIVDLPAHRGFKKSQILKEVKVDLAKYNSDGSKPGITSIKLVCEYLEICPGMVILIACWVKEQKINYQQAIWMLANQEMFDHLFVGLQYGVITLLEEKSDV